MHELLLFAPLLAWPLAVNVVNRMTVMQWCSWFSLFWVVHDLLVDYGCCSLLGLCFCVSVCVAILLYLYA